MYYTEMCLVKWKMWTCILLLIKTSYCYQCVDYLHVKRTIIVPWNICTLSFNKLLLDIISLVQDTKTFYSSGDQSLRSKESSHANFGSFWSHQCSRFTSQINVSFFFWVVSNNFLALQHESILEKILIHFDTSPL